MKYRVCVQRITDFHGYIHAENKDLAKKVAIDMAQNDELIEGHEEVDILMIEEVL